MGEDLEKLKQRLPLLDYLQRQNCTRKPALPFTSTPARTSSTATAAARVES